MFIIISLIHTLQTTSCSFPNRVDEINSNSDSDTLRRLQNPLYDETPATRQGEGEGEGPGPTYEIVPMMTNINNRQPKAKGATTSTTLPGQSDYKAHIILCLKKGLPYTRQYKSLKPSTFLQHLV